ncbi:protein kinase C-binding protein NELL2-like isoform X2 [Branchiostoma floridae]|uniref:Protein kinase C-binding protein NELL2-like isoform X2 n=1 Tax=Branchiostoma floridae TaxID=7739 RepID=A0A9J7KJV9_BRAFL|nr:protein kinase C-binding protein NELL2-like isoform X2 [Branchiostoma floridae]
MRTTAVAILVFLSTLSHITGSAGSGSPADVEINLIRGAQLEEQAKQKGSGVKLMLKGQGQHGQSNAFLLIGPNRNLEASPEAFERARSLLAKSDEVTFSAIIKQDNRNSGSIISFFGSDGRYLELETSRRKNTIRFHYRSRGKLQNEVFFYQLDNQWHKVSLTISGQQAILHVDCNQIYKRKLKATPSLDLYGKGVSLWLGQRSKDRLVYEGGIQDAKIIVHPRGYQSQCPDLDKPCPTCGDISSLVDTVKDLTYLVAKLNATQQPETRTLASCDCPQVCFVGPQTYRERDSWIDGCSECTCLGGEVQCALRACPEVPCPKPTVPEGECCPVCGAPCSYYGKDLQDGEYHALHVDVGRDVCYLSECVDGNMQQKQVTVSEFCPALDCDLSLQTLEEEKCCNICQVDPSVSTDTDIEVIQQPLKLRSFNIELKETDHCLEGNECHSNATCVNMPTGYTCLCKEGFLGDGRTCTDVNVIIQTTFKLFETFNIKDVDECASIGSPYSHSCGDNTRCVNLPGSYICECLPGYKQLTEHKCTDQNECALGMDHCHPNAQCENTMGSYVCRCNPGFEGDGMVCTPVCTTPCENGGLCIAPDYCSCPAGFTGKACETDIDECAAGNPCPDHSDCVNLPGWYFCQCKPGYKSKRNENRMQIGACEDIDECWTGDHNCPSTTDCINIGGSYKCKCIDPATCSGSCIYEESEYRNGESWRPDGDRCGTCTCQDSIVTCREDSCNCEDKNTDMYCCPECDRTMNCLHQDQTMVYNSSDTWMYQCQICKCLKGEIDCSPLTCPELTCKHTYIPEGECCPRCDPCYLPTNEATSDLLQTCMHNGIVYAASTNWAPKDEPCTRCECKGGRACCHVTDGCR